MVWYTSPRLTPSALAFSRFTSASTWGTLTWKLENRPASAGSFRLAAIRFCVCWYSSLKPRSPRSSICMRKPPIVPRPITGGGGNTAMYASWIEANFWFSAPAIAPAERSALRRSSNGFSVTNTMPELVELVKPLIDRPGKATACSTPGCFSAIAPMRWITSSERSSEAASGSCANATRYCLSWPGTKPVGTCEKPNQVSAIRPAYTTSASLPLPTTRLTPPT